MIPSAPSPPLFRDLFRSKVSEPAKPVPPSRTGFFSSKNFLRLGLIFAFLFAVVQLAGLREYTSVLNGTVGNPGAGWGRSVFYGTVYVLAYLGFLLVSPILLIAAALLKAGEWFLQR